jgi:hypothetical protein
LCAQRRNEKQEGEESQEEQAGYHSAHAATTSQRTLLSQFTDGKSVIKTQVLEIL